MPTPEQPSKRQVNIDLPPDLEPKYSNVALIAHSAAEIIIDFAQFLPGTRKGKVQSRIVMTPMHAKLLQAALSQNLSQYEAKFGVIQTHQGPSLADQLFKPVSPPEDSK